MVSVPGVSDGLAGLIDNERERVNTPTLRSDSEAKQFFFKVRQEVLILDFIRVSL